MAREERGSPTKNTTRISSSSSMRSHSLAAPHCYNLTSLKTNCPLSCVNNNSIHCSPSTSRRELSIDTLGTHTTMAFSTRFAPTCQGLKPSTSQRCKGEWSVHPCVACRQHRQARAVSHTHDKPRRDSLLSLTAHHTIILNRLARAPAARARLQRSRRGQQQQRAAGGRPVGGQPPRRARRRPRSCHGQRAAARGAARGERQQAAVGRLGAGVCVCELLALN
jgi:hypothetical protein